MQITIKQIEDGVAHVAIDLRQLILFLSRFVESAAPVAAAVGTATGQPEVTAAAAIAGVAATATDKGLSAIPTPQTPIPPDGH